jgi:hypothetical protein
VSPTGEPAICVYCGAEMQVDEVRNVDLQLGVCRGCLRQLQVIYEQRESTGHKNQSQPEKE